MAKRRDRFGIQEERHVLLDNLQKAGFTDEDIDCIVLSHLHFDHAGGLLTAYDPEEPMRLLFPNATFVVSWDAWQRAKHPTHETVPRSSQSFPRCSKKADVSKS
jgi:metal-dependent hydrolase (beta-lactamase superfamily II)